MISYFYELGFEAGLSVQQLNELYEEALSRMLRPREVADEIIYKETRLGEKVQIWPFPLSAADEHGIPPMAPWTERNRPE